MLRESTIAIDKELRQTPLGQCLTSPTDKKENKDDVQRVD